MKDFDDSGAPQTSPFLARLAGSPLLVVAVTLAIGVAVTGILMWVAPMDSVAIVTTLATVWGLDLALVIYLLTAKDTDKLLAHIDALQDQLSAALEGPGPDAVVVEPGMAPQVESTASEPSPQEVSQPGETPHGVTVTVPENIQTTVPARSDSSSQAPTQSGASHRVPAQSGPASPEATGHGAPAQPGRAPKAHPHGTAPVPQSPVPQVPVPQAAPVPQPAPESLPVTAYMPKEYVEALRNQLRMETEDIVRAWTPNPHGTGPWVVEDAKGDRWSVFQGRRNQPTVISLESRERLRQIHEEKQEVRARLHDENQQRRRQTRDEAQQRVHALQDEEQQRVHALQDARSGRIRRKTNK